MIKMKNILALIVLLTGINTAFAYEPSQESYDCLKVGSLILLEDASDGDKFRFGFHVYEEPDSKSSYRIYLSNGPVKILEYARNEQMFGITAPWIKITFKGLDQDEQGYVWAGDFLKNVQLIPGGINTSFVIEQENDHINILAIAATGEKEGQIIGKLSESMDGNSLDSLPLIVEKTDANFVSSNYGSQVAVLEVAASYSAYDFLEYSYYYVWIDDHFVKLLTARNEGIGDCGGQYLEQISTAPHGLFIKTIQLHADGCGENAAAQKPLFNVIVYQWDDREERLIEQKQTPGLIRLNDPK